MNKKLFIDLETTGLNPLLNGITEIAALLIDIDTKEIVDSFNVKIKPFPFDQIDPKSLQLQNITLPKIFKNDRYHYAEIAFDAFIDFLDKNNINGIDIYSYNVKFDYDFLYSFFLKNYSWSFYKYFSKNPKCVLELTKGHYQLHSYKLQDVAESLQIKNVGKYHNAMNDILITYEIYKSFDN